jgi:hypothetical protein
MTSLQARKTHTSIRRVPCGNRLLLVVISAASPMVLLWSEYRERMVDAGNLRGSNHRG